LHFSDFSAFFLWPPFPYPLAFCPYINLANITSAIVKVAYKCPHGKQRKQLSRHTDNGSPGHYGLEINYQNYKPALAKSNQDKAVTGLFVLRPAEYSFSSLD